MIAPPALAAPHAAAPLIAAAVVAPVQQGDAPVASPTTSVANSANQRAVPVTLLGPAGGTAVWTITDGVRSVTGSATFGSGTSVTVTADVSSLADGTLTVTVAEVDANGNTASAAPTTLLKDTTPPAATLALDGGVALTRQKTLALALAGDGTAAQTQLQVTLGSTVVYSGAFTGSVALGADGTYTVVATLRDAFGNTTTLTRTIVLDTAGPTLTAPASGAVYDVGAAVGFGWSPSDANGIASQAETLDGAAIAVGSALDLNSLTAGTHSIQISATDGAGNVSTKTITFAIHPSPQGILAALNTVTFFVTATLKASLVNQMQYVIAAMPNGNSASPRLRSFISMVQSATAAQIAPAYQALLLSWANDLLARL